MLSFSVRTSSICSATGCLTNFASHTTNYPKPYGGPTNHFIVEMNYIFKEAVRKICFLVHLLETKLYVSAFLGTVPWLPFRCDSHLHYNPNCIQFYSFLKRWCVSILTRCDLTIIYFGNIIHQEKYPFQKTCPPAGLGKLPSLLPNKEISFSIKTWLTCKREKFPTKNSYFHANLEAFNLRHFEVHHETWSVSLNLVE